MYNNPVRYVDPSGHFTEEEIRQYLKKYVGDRWKELYDLWRTDETWCLRSAQEGDLFVTMSEDGQAFVFEFENTDGFLGLKLYTKNLKPGRPVRLEEVYGGKWGYWLGVIRKNTEEDSPLNQTWENVAEGLGAGTWIHDVSMVEELLIYEGSASLVGTGLMRVGLISGGPLGAVLGFLIGEVATKGLLVEAGVPREGDVLIWMSLTIDHRFYYTHITVKEGNLARIDPGAVSITETQVKVEWFLPQGAAP